MDVNFKAFLTSFNELFTLFCVFPALIFFGLYLSFRLRFVQISKLKMSFLCLMKKNEKSQGNISHYQAISTVLAGNFGTGNISGMAVALSTGGPGALVWMWVMAFLGATVQYASCLLGVKYRQKNAQGEYIGGPMYYLSDGLGMKKTGYVFAIFTVIAALTVGSFAQINSIVLPLQQMGFDPLLCGIVMAFFVGLVILRGTQSVAKLASFIVPIKAFLYLVTAATIIIWHANQVIPAFKLMLHCAFHQTSVVGGVLGFGIFKAITAGFDRGLFATDAGTGLVPILQASAKTDHPVVDGVVTLVAPFLVMIVCTMTGLVLLVTGAWQQVDLHSTTMVTYAFQKGLGSPIGVYIVLIALILFGYTTILAWACCAEKALNFLTGHASLNWFKYLYIMLIPIGTMLNVDLIWILSDISISLMLVTNLIGIAGLSKQVIGTSRAFFIQQVNPQMT
jgi:AGCS family alanine or glycine:cation symporter